METNQLKEAVKVLEDAGIEFVIYDISEGGCRDLHPQDIPLYIEDKFKYFALLYNVSIKQLRAYTDFMKDRQCTAMTRARKRCKHSTYRMGKVSEFKYGETTLCARHLKDFLSENTSAF